MPKKFAKRKTKRAYKRKFTKTARKSTTMVQKGISPISSRYIAKLHYADTITLSTLGGNSSAVHEFRLNSLFDPDLSGVGHQPYGFDTLAGIYNRYRVFYTSYVVKMRSNTTNAVWGIFNGNQIGPLSSQSSSYLMELPRSYHKSTSTSDTTMIKGHISLANLNGSTRVAYMADDRFQAAITASPAEAMNLQVWVCSDSLASYKFDIELTYHAEFFDPTPLAQS